MVRLVSRYILLGICSFLHIQVTAQFTLKSDTELNEAVNHIQQMHHGAVLIRLHTQEHAIRYYHERGDYDSEARIREKQREINTEIALAFRGVFDFSKMYFFYSHHSDEVEQGKLDAGFFVNENLEEDPSIKLDSSLPVYVIDLGDVFFDTFGSSMKGLVVMNQSFEPLKKPFPYIVRKRSGLKILERSVLDVVTKLNENLNTFYGAHVNESTKAPNLPQLEQ